MKRTLEFLQTAWLMLGVTLLCFLVLELGSQGYYALKSRIFKEDSSPTTSAQKAGDFLMQADGYKGVGWVDEYVQEFDACDRVHWVPYVYWRRDPCYGKYIQIDPQGIRRTFTSRPIRNASKQFKIFMFGGSAMWGTGARDEYTIPSFIVKKLAEHGLNVEIVNFGESGYVSTQEVITLCLQLQQGHLPDLVIFYDGINDTFSAYQQSVAGLSQNEQNREKEFNVSKRLRRNLDEIFLGHQFFANSLLYTLRHLHILRLTKNVLNAVLFHKTVLTDDERSFSQLILEKVLSPSFSYDYKKWDAHAVSYQRLEEEVVARYVANCNMVEALGQKFDFIPLFYWQPTVFTKSPLTQYEQQQVALADQDLKILFDRVYALVEQSPLSEHLVNLSKIFAAHPEPVFLDWMHVTETGNELIAGRMAQDILERISTP